MSVTATSYEADAAGFSRGAATVAFAGGLGSLAILAALHLVRPDLAPGAHVISEYAIGYSPLGLAFFAAQSLGCLAMAGALLSSATTIGVRIGIALLVLAAIGLGMAVLFPMDALTTPAGEETFAGAMHGVAALVGIPTFIAATLVLAYTLRKRGHWAPVGGWLVGFAHLTWIGLAAMVACMVLLLTQGMTVMGDLVGYANRLLVIAYACWLMFAAWPLMRSDR
ncbi:MAG: DUF998 domain-containing protein [Devosia sp.]